MDGFYAGMSDMEKTELAFRAAFKAMEAGYQVAVLVPTTILAEQHYRTFRERLAEFPFTVEFINRFKTKSEQAIIVAQAANGKIDLLVGTHRLLSSDVSFANLGLVIVDEEQRFGVIHKERLKKLRATVDILNPHRHPDSANPAHVANRTAGHQHAGHPASGSPVDPYGDSKI